MWTSSVRTPMASAAICEKTVSAPWPISVAPICSWMVPSWLSVTAAVAVSSANGATAVLYTKKETPTPWRMGPVSLAYSRFFLSHSM